MTDVAPVDPERLPLASRHTRLRAPSRHLLDRLYDLATTDQIAWWWRSAAETPESFRESLWNGVLVQFGVEDVRSGQAIGLLSAQDANLVHGYCYASMMLLPEYRGRVWPLESALLFANYLFVKFNLRNIYADVAASHFAPLRSGVGTHFEIEGRLRDRLVVDSEVQDLYVLRFSRARWIRHGRPLLERCLGRTSR